MRAWKVLGRVLFRPPKLLLMSTLRDRGPTFPLSLCRWGTRGTATPGIQTLSPRLRKAQERGNSGDGERNIELRTIKAIHRALFLSLKGIYRISPGWCGSVDWAPGLHTKGLLVQFPIRAHTRVAGQVPSRGCVRGNHTLMFLSFSVSRPSPRLKLNK